MACALAVPNGPDVTDARLPDRWLMNKRLMTLPDAAFRLYVVGLMMSVSNRADGRLDKDDLNMMFCDTGPELRDELVRRELWAVDGDGWLITDFLTTQTSAAKLKSSEEYAARERERKRRPARASSGKARARAGDSAGTAHADPQEDTGQDRDRTGREVEESPDQRFSGSDAAQMVTPLPDRLSTRARRLREEGEAS